MLLPLLPAHFAQPLTLLGSVGSEYPLQEAFCLFPLPGLRWTERCLCCWLRCIDSASLRSPGIYVCSSISLYHLVGDYLLLCCCKFTTLLL